ncbi:hypothetical protein D3C78_1340460 [compost metagenome]
MIGEGGVLEHLADVQPAACERLPEQRDSLYRAGEEDGLQLRRAGCGIKGRIEREGPGDERGGHGCSARISIAATCHGRQDHVARRGQVNRVGAVVGEVRQRSTVGKGCHGNYRVITGDQLLGQHFGSGIEVGGVVEGIVVVVALHVRSPIAGSGHEQDVVPCSAHDGLV